MGANRARWPGLVPRRIGGRTFQIGHTGVIHVSIEHR
jgi:hypothetical protein